jgi:hypothetical protein
VPRFDVIASISICIGIKVIFVGAVGYGSFRITCGADSDPVRWVLITALRLRHRWSQLPVLKGIDPGIHINRPLEVKQIKAIE